MNINPKNIEDYCHQHSSPEPKLLQELVKETYEKSNMPTMLSGRLCGRLLKMLVQLTGARRVLEIGMFTGYSALSIAEGLPDDGKVITCDVDESVAKMAKSFFARSPHGHKIEMVIQDALKTLTQIPGDFDLVFIDADKKNHKNYYELSLNKLKSGGMIVLDNSLWSGKVLNPDDENSLALADLNEYITRDERVENVLLPVRDGFNLVRKI